DQVGSMFAGIEAELGPVELLVTNAGIARSADGAGMTAETWREIMAVNLDGTFHTVWQAKDRMRERGFGRIVCLSSILGLNVNPINPERLIAYSTAKAAVIGFVRHCAAAFGPTVRVNGVAPGFIETDMTADVTPEARDRLMAATPMRRIGEPDEVADVVHFLLSDRSNFVTGHTHVVSGGL
ncbi:MAG: SDR family NAD(P)-dependent oxidoreductase, partial [Geminicoccaceae bacterium]